MAAPTNMSSTVSRQLDDQTLVELIYDPERRATSLAICAPSGETRVEQELTLASGERLVPYSGRNNLLTSGCVLLPSEIGARSEKEQLIEAIVAYLRRYVALPSSFELMAAYYVLLSWVFDAFSDLPYLRFRGDFGTGKTRALIVIGSICYKPFFASGASTVSPIFHIQDVFQGTLILDEADFRFSDATAQLTKLLNNGSSSGLPVLRTMTNRNRELNPQAFRVYGPKMIAMREHFSDQALESRFLTCETLARPLSPDLPVHLPPHFSREAQDLRNQLLAWRFSSRFSIGPDPSRAASQVGPRYRQSSLALLSLIDDSGVRALIEQELASYEAVILQERSHSLEAAMIAAIRDTFELADGPCALIGDIAARFNLAAADELGRAASPKWVGGFIRGKLRLATLRTGGVYGVPLTERPRLVALAQRYGIAGAAQSTTLSP